MTFAKSLLTLALLAGFMPNAGLAQTTSSGAAPLACPVSIDLTYQRIERLPFDGKGFDIAGFAPRFSPTSARLINATVNTEVDIKQARDGGIADNFDSAKPGEALVFTIWAKGEKAPAYAAHASCEYEGGYMLQQALPASTRSCALRTANKKMAPGETTTRTFLASAVFACK